VGRRLRHLHLRDSDISATHATDVADALQWNGRESQSVQRFAFHSLLAEPQRTAVHRAITAAVPPAIRVDLSAAGHGDST
jgi:hypothetical protein